MKSRIIKILSFVICLSVIVGLSGCGTAAVKRSDKPEYSAVKTNISDGLVFENKNFILDWDSETNSPKITDKTNGKVYYTAAPLSQVDNINETMIYRSAVSLDYAEQPSLGYETAYSADTENCSVSAEKTENGIKAVYDFKECKISVPVLYLLTDSGMEISVDVNGITEGKNKIIYLLHIAPALNRLPNNSQDGYFLVPSGSGALVSTGSGLVRRYQESVYGDDTANPKFYDATKEDETIRMPIYGSEIDNAAVFTIIDDGAANANINIILNESKLKYSSCYPSFFLRGRERVEENVAATKVETYYYDPEIVDTDISVKYYFMNGDNANYSGMAEIYGDYIDEKYGKSDSDFSNASPYSLKILGGVERKSFVFGVPYTSLYKLTSLKEADKIISEISEKTDVNPIVQLMGYGTSGLDNGKIAGGFNLAKSLGSLSEVAGMQKKLSDKGGELILDFDIVNYSKSAGGFSVGSDIAKTVNNEKSEVYYQHMALGIDNKMFKPYFMISRNKIQAVADKLYKKITKQNISAVSLSTLGNTAYSDNTDRAYFAKNGMDKAYLSAIKQFNASMTVAVNSANDHAAATANYVLDSPIQTSKYDFFTAEIPFYQMVFGARTPQYITAVNFSTESKTAILKAAESGSGLSFTVLKNYETDLVNTTQSVLQFCVYDSVKNDIVETVKEYTDYYNSVKGAKIVSHSVSDSGVRITVFDNDVAVYTNYGDKSVEIDGVTVEAQDYVVKKV